MPTLHAEASPAESAETTPPSACARMAEVTIGSEQTEAEVVTSDASISRAPRAEG
jgi:hypothetical protein